MTLPSRSKPVRVPADVAREAEQIAGLQGVAPGEVLADAWRDYLEKHREQFAADLAEAARLLRAGDTDGLAAFASRNVEERARRAAARIRGAQ